MAGIIVSRERVENALTLVKKGIDKEREEVEKEEARLEGIKKKFEGFEEYCENFLKGIEEEGEKAVHEELISEARDKFDAEMAKYEEDKEAYDKLTWFGKLSVRSPVAPVLDDTPTDVMPTYVLTSCEMGALVSNLNGGGFYKEEGDGLREVWYRLVEPLTRESHLFRYTISYRHADDVLLGTYSKVLKVPEVKGNIIGSNTYSIEATSRRYGNIRTRLWGLEDVRRELQNLHPSSREGEMILIDEADNRLLRYFRDDSEEGHYGTTK